MNRQKHTNLRLRIRNVCELAQKYYEPGRQDRSYKAVWRNYVYPVYPMCYNQFLTYINTPMTEIGDPPKRPRECHRQLTLWDQDKEK